MYICTFTLLMLEKD